MIQGGMFILITVVNSEEEELLEFLLGLIL